MTKLSTEIEEVEYFIEEYTNQIRIMAGLTDLQIKVVVKQLIEEDPEWYEVLRKRFRYKQLKKTKELIKGVQSDLKGEIKDLARKVA